MSLEHSILKLIEKKSQTAIKIHMKSYVHKIEGIVKDWRAWAREKLSLKKVGRKRNDTLFPKLRTGKLRASLYTRKIALAKRFPGTIQSNQAVFRIPIAYKKLRGNGVDDYGDYLDKQYNAPLKGWRLRLRKELEKRIAKRI